MNRLGTLVLGCFLATCIVGPSLAVASLPTASAPATLESPADKAPQVDEARYATREAKAQPAHLENFQGGGFGIYIGGGALTVALLIVLLVILL